MAVIAVVEDEQAIARLISLHLQSAGYEPKLYETGDEFLRSLRGDVPDLVLLDWMLPGENDGIAVLKALRANEKTRAVPVIMLTAKAEELDRILGLEVGADDYLTKPFGVMELVSRVKAVLRRCRPQPVAVLRCGGLVVDEQEHTVTADGVRVVLTYKEYQLLRLFLSHPGTAFTRDQLMEQVWGMDFYGESRTVDMHIRTLRQKIGPYGGCIETVRSVGYRWRAQP